MSMKIEFNFCYQHFMQAMMLNDRIGDILKLQSALVKAEELLTKLPTNKPNLILNMSKQKTKATGVILHFAKLWS